MVAGRPASRRRVHARQARCPTSALRSGLDQAGACEQLADDLLGRVVAALAELGVADAPVPVDEVHRRPEPVVVGVPGRERRVEGHRVGQSGLGHGVADVAELALERQLGRVDADHDEPGVRVALGPCLHVRLDVDAVDAGEGPELDEDGPAPEGGHRLWLGVDPGVDPDEVGRRPEVLERHRARQRRGDGRRQTAPGASVTRGSSPGGRSRPRRSPRDPSPERHPAGPRSPPDRSRRVPSGRSSKARSWPASTRRAVASIRPPSARRPPRPTRSPRPRPRCPSGPRWRAVPRPRRRSRRR